MKTTTKTMMMIAGLALAAVPAMAQTTWTGAENNDITEALNWNNGLPTSAGNPGTINSGTVEIFGNISGYFITQEDGAVESSVGSLSIGNSSWTLNDGSITVLGLTITSGGSLNITGGTFTANNTTNASAIRPGAGSIVTISGGIISLSQEIRNASTLTFEGGVTTLPSNKNIRWDSGGQYIMGGTTAGSLTAGGISAGTGGVNFNMDWLSGSRMEVTVSNVNNWAETYWTSNQLTFNGQDSTDLGNWADVNGTVFDWDGTTNTLALIPEPSTLALLGLAGLAAMALRRRRKLAR